MKFKINEGDYSYEKYLEFIKLYNNPKLSVKEIQKKLELSRGEYRRLLKLAIEEKQVTKRGHNKKKSKKEHKYYSRDISTGYNYFNVKKRINGKLVFFGNFKTVEQAELMVEKLKECNWDTSQTEKLKKEVMQNA